MKKFDVKKREYFGNTSMEAEISLLMANQSLVWFCSIESYHEIDIKLGQASPNKLIYDPFVGTGSMIYVDCLYTVKNISAEPRSRQPRISGRRCLAQISMGGR